MADMVLQNLSVSALVFARLAGMIGMNPVFSRRNVPFSVRTGLILLMTVLLAPNAAVSETMRGGWLGLAEGLFKELLIGFACGYVFQFFYYMLFFVGDLMDIQFGLSMAKVFDPGSHIQMSLSSNFLNFLFILYLFVTDSHLLMIQIFATSFKIIPAGGMAVSTEIWSAMAGLFAMVFSLGVRLALPFIAVEFILEASMGVLMKLIPQIHVFVINIQLKVLMGIFLLLSFAGPISGFVDNYMRIMFEYMERALYLMS